MSKNDYDFAVHLDNLWTQEGVRIPGYKAVMRTDTSTPLSVVSDKYSVITHKEAIDSVLPAIRGFDQKFEQSVSLQRNGANMCAVYNFRKQHEVANVGDLVGLRCYVFNSYNASSSLRVQVGGLVLKCTNGMTGIKPIMDFTRRHYGDQAAIPKLTTELIEASFEEEVAVWNFFGETKVKNPLAIAEKAFEMKCANKSCTDFVIDKCQSEKTNFYWDLLQHYTYFITHEAKGNHNTKVEQTKAITKHLLREAKTAQ